MKDLKETAKLMSSKNYKERFKAEYWQNKIRYEKLKDFNNKIEASRATCCEGAKVVEPLHDCPANLLKEQQKIMGEYLHILEVRAVIEGVDLNE